VIKESGKKWRPFSELADLKCRGYSRRLQRTIVDFGADHSFGEAQKKIREHYGIEVPVSGIQFVTENHAKTAHEYVGKQKRQFFEQGKADILICEMDGSMVPIVETSIPDARSDNRKCKEVRWQEARLCMSRHPKEVIPIFYATLGCTDEAGDLLHLAAKRAGMGPKTYIHGLGDGARWIEMQMRLKFQNRVKYLVDFYHMSEYLAEAANHSWTSEKEKWLKEKQALLKENKHELVLESIRVRLPLDWDPKQKEEEGTPVEKCYKYISNRQNCLDYKGALEKGLPIGSGEIESGHRSVIQKRMKIPGAWWREDNAESMLALRSLRANGDWQDYWNQRAA
jgi:hypothetical protein